MPGLEQHQPEPAAVVIFGASGALTYRKLGPAIYNLAREGLLPEGTAVIGYGRTRMSDEAFRNRLAEGIARHSRTRPMRAGVWDELAARVFYQRGVYDAVEDYRRLERRMRELDQCLPTRGNRLFYLAVPPSAVTPILHGLSEAGSLHRQPRCSVGQGCYLRVVFEKPFGYDLASARALNDEIDRLLDEQQVFRMDHYLGKETVQNIGVLRFANSIFEHVWHAGSVSWIRVTVAETVGVEERGAYFDSTGILRDILQNHVLQLLTLVTMEPPASLHDDAVRDEKAKVLRCLRRIEGAEVGRSVVRGQYGAGLVGGRPVPAYRDEPGVDPHSATETFVGIRAYVDNWRWAGVPIYLCTGKRLAAHMTEVSVQFRQVPRVLFGAMKGLKLKPNRLTLRIQPDEGVSLRFTNKVPGLAMRLRDVEMSFPYESAFRAGSPEAYERLLLDVMSGNNGLFARRDEVELAWQFATSILEAWENGPPPRFPNYAPGTWGPLPPDRFFREGTDYSVVLREEQTRRV